MSPVYSRYWAHTTLDHTQWALPFNMNDFKREDIDREVTPRKFWIKALCGRVQYLRRSDNLRPQLHTGGQRVAIVNFLPT